MVGWLSENTVMFSKHWPVCLRIPTSNSDSTNGVVWGRANFWPNQWKSVKCLKALIYFITHFSFKTEFAKKKKKTQKDIKRKKKKREVSHSWKSLQAFVAIQSFNNGEKVSIMRSINQQGCLHYVNKKWNKESVSAVTSLGPEVNFTSFPLSFREHFITFFICSHD